jgi:hypothetical protein
MLSAALIATRSVPPHDPDSLGGRSIAAIERDHQGVGAFVRVLLARCNLSRLAAEQVCEGLAILGIVNREGELLAIEFPASLRLLEVVSAGRESIGLPAVLLAAEELNLPRVAARQVLGEAGLEGVSLAVDLVLHLSAGAWRVDQEHPPRGSLRR